ncbi:MAG TPA: rRNA adenine N-6-methyltransferase family protein, partial [Planctomycetota bacterium]|nr:rRNA adenine N-6-methyltransferase family protein [Planctomycetota bacterium]
MPEPSKLQRLKAALAARGLSPRKMFGQNFMVDTNFAAAIARDATLDRQSLAIEVGPGTGLLTEALLASSPDARVLAQRNRLGDELRATSSSFGNPAEAACAA